MNHSVVPVQQAYKEMSDLLGGTEAKVQQMIQERNQKVQWVKQSKKEAADEMADSMRDLTALLSEIQVSQVELVKVMDEKQKAAEEQAECCVSSMEGEITELQETMMKLRELKQTEDQLRFLQNFPNTCVLPHTMDLSSFHFDKHLKLQQVRKSLSSSVSQLRTLLSKMKTEIDVFCGSANVSDETLLTYMQQYEVNILLDPSTAHPLLILSDNWKEVRYSMGSGLWANQNPNPNMFTEHLAVLGQKGFSSRKFYFEVFIGQKSEWCLGVATASVQRRGGFARRPHCGLWALWFLEDKFETFSSPNVTVHWGKVERVGVFVDYDGGQVSFYDVHTAAPIYTFSECFFTEELYPYFNPCDNEYGSNLDPMIIVPVSRTY